MAADLFRVVWTPVGSTDVASKPMRRERAMARFDAYVKAPRTIRGEGRLRVLREADWQQSRTT